MAKQKVESNNSDVKPNTLRPSEFIQLAQILIPARETMLVTGSPGVGKSDGLRQAAALTDVDLIVMHPAISDPTKYEGLPFPSHDHKSAVFLPYGELYSIITATRPTLVVLEDFGQATTAVQAAAMQLLHSATGERRLGDKTVPEHITFALTSNRRTDRAGVQGILETVKSRCATIIDVMPTLEDWKDWAMRNGIAPQVLGFLNFRKELFHVFQPTADLINHPSPRTWAAVSRLMKLGIPRNIRQAVYSGAVGDGAAAELIAYLDIAEEAPDIEDILANPKTAPIPDADKPAVLYAVASSLAHAANASTMKAVVTYATRMHKANLTEFTVLIMVDALRRDHTLSKNTTFREWANSDIGKHIIAAKSLS